MGVSATAELMCRRSVVYGFGPTAAGASTTTAVLRDACHRAVPEQRLHGGLAVRGTDPVASPPAITGPAIVAATHPDGSDGS
jgi:hypothetical protein